MAAVSPKVHSSIANDALGISFSLDGFAKDPFFDCKGYSASAEAVSHLILITDSHSYHCAMDRYGNQGLGGKGLFRITAIALDSNIFAKLRSFSMSLEELYLKTVFAHCCDGRPNPLLIITMNLDEIGEYDRWRIWEPVINDVLSNFIVQGQDLAVESRIFNTTQPSLSIDGRMWRGMI
jgi:hypothetical protein